MKKKIALFGATGQTGYKFLIAALNAGYEIKALVRDKTKLNLTHSNLTIFQGDVLNQQDVIQNLKDTNIVISLFGHVKGSPEWLQTNGTKNILAAMHMNNINRIISLSGGGLPFPQMDKPKLADKIIRTIMKIVVPKILDDAIAHHKEIEKSGLNWVIIRAPRLTNELGLGKYRVGWVGVNASTKISRTDLADFILSQVENEKYNFQMPFVTMQNT